MTHPDPNSHRVLAEKSFHNAKFSADHGTSQVSKYYLALQNWYSDYFHRVLSQNSSHVLEIGSGVESLSLQVDKASFSFNSIDISETAIAYTKEHTRLKHADFSVDDAHQMKFADGSFDMVIGRGILHHLDIPVACAEIKRVLRPGGKIVFGEPLDGNVLINIYRKLTPNIRSRDERPLSTDALDVMRSHFGSLNITYYGFLTIGPALFGWKSPEILHQLDQFILNKLRLGRFFAWACLISS